MEKRLYLVTGADGHLGGTILRQLIANEEEVRGLILPGNKKKFPGQVDYYEGNITDPDTLENFFTFSGKRRVICIHTAGLVDISGKLNRRLYETNVLGTRNIIKMCVRHKVSRLIYTSSVHAIPENGKDGMIREIDDFSIYRLVEGGYAKTKAMATLCVLRAVQKGLDAVVLHPSGIIGPYESPGNHLVQLIKDYMEGLLPACVKGSYDFVDVRDIAEACIAAADKAQSGQCYILSNKRYQLSEILDIVRHYAGGPRLLVLPVFAARMMIPVLYVYSKLTKQRPLFTAYSLHTLGSNSYFSHEKAAMELGYHPRDIEETIRDTVDWISYGDI
ncbi:MAG: NAD-dependent epimerase/dehydratase family protein [Eubacteriales bacterium]|nr:NAD-dependent epimerase/dehydratase family protein [Eubacteriales bacterium]